MEILYENLLKLEWQQVVMWAIGGILIFLAIKKDMEPTLLLPIGFGAILVNLPFSGAVTQIIDGTAEEGALSILFDAGIANELFPLILFIGIGAMIDFGPLLSNPKLMIFGAAAQFGIFFTLCVASMFFDINDAASIAIIGAADGPTSIVVAQKLMSKYLGAIMVAAYSYMALVPIIQPPIIKLLTTKKERMNRTCFRIPYRLSYVWKPDSRMRGTEFSVRNSAKGFSKPDHYFSWYYDCNKNAGRSVPADRNPFDFRARLSSLYFRHCRRRTICKIYQFVY